jgi:hypothetical protein
MPADTGMPHPTPSISIESRTSSGATTGLPDEVDGAALADAQTERDASTTTTAALARRMARPQRA